MANFSKSHIVCECKNVTLGEIAHAVENRGANSIDDIKEQTDAGTACGCCVSKEKDVNTKKMELYISQILNKFKKES